METATSTSGTIAATGFEPKLVAFVCNWCTYTGADLAGTSRLKMAPNVRVIRLNCSSRVNPLFVIKAFEKGADAVPRTTGTISKAIPLVLLINPIDVFRAVNLPKPSDLAAPSAGAGQTTFLPLKTAVLAVLCVAFWITLSLATGLWKLRRIDV